MAAARETSDSVTGPTPTYTTLTPTAGEPRVKTASRTASAVPCTSALTIQQRSLFWDASSSSSSSASRRSSSSSSPERLSSTTPPRSLDFLRIFATAALPRAPTGACVCSSSKARGVPASSPASAARASSHSLDPSVDESSTAMSSKPPCSSRPTCARMLPTQSGSQGIAFLQGMSTETHGAVDDAGASSPPTRVRFALGGSSSRGFASRS